MFILFQCIINSITKPLAHTFNKSLEDGIFPDKMKLAKILAVYTKVTKTNLNNYRPISILTMYSKMLEKIYVSRLNFFLLNNSIINKCQYGFKKRSVTVHALHDIFSSLDKNQLCMGIFIDLRKAFDTVDHEILVEKLEFYGVRGTSGIFLDNISVTDLSISE